MMGGWKVRLVLYNFLCPWRLSSIMFCHLHNTRSVILNWPSKIFSAHFRLRNTALHSWLWKIFFYVFFKSCSIKNKCQQFWKLSDSLFSDFLCGCGLSNVISFDVCFLPWSKLLIFKQALLIKRRLILEGV